MMSENSKTVALISHELSLTGAPIALLNMAIQFERLGYKPVILSDKDGPLREEIVRKNIEIIVSPEMYSADFIKHIAEQADLIIANTLESLPAVSMLNGLDIPVLWWIHEAKLSYHDYHKYTLPLWLHSNVVVAAVGSRAKGSLAKIRPQYRIRELMYPLPLVPRADDNQKILPEGTPGTITYTLVGQLVKRKGQDILIEAIEKLSDRVLSMSRFIFVGNGLEDDIVDLIISKSKQCPDKIIYIPQIDRNHIGRLYNQIDCLICASRDDPMPVVVAEACQMGKLIICSDNTGSAQLIKEYNAGLIYHDDSTEELSDCITRICNGDIPEPEVMMKSAKRLYEDIFSEKSFSESMELLLDSMINASKTGDGYRDKIETDPVVISILETANAGIAELRHELDTVTEDNEKLRKDYQTVQDSFNEIENAFF